MGLETLLMVGLIGAGVAAMSSMGGGGDEAPSPQPLPAIPDTAKAEADAEAEMEAKRRAMLDRDKTILTSPLGDTTTATTQRKTLLGQ